MCQKSIRRVATVDDASTFINLEIGYPSRRLTQIASRRQMCVFICFLSLTILHPVRGKCHSVFFLLITLDSNHRVENSRATSSACVWARNYTYILC